MFDLLNITILTDTIIYDEKPDKKRSAASHSAGLRKYAWKHSALQSLLFEFLGTCSVSDSGNGRDGYRWLHTVTQI